MPSTSTEIRFAPRWLHAWSVLTAGATVALLALGAVVTTFQVGMADPVWPTVPWHLALIDWSEPNPGFVIEHSHRLAGYVVGCCVIVLTVGLLLSAQRNWLKWVAVAALAGVIVAGVIVIEYSRTIQLAIYVVGCWVIVLTVGLLLSAQWNWLKWMGAAALAGVSVQGLLGGFRVVLHAWLGTNLAVIHGCFAQIVFSLLVSLAVLTSPQLVAEPPTEDTPRLRHWSLLLAALVFFQLIWGALLRHTGGALAQRMHLATAFAVVAVAVWFAHTALANPPARRLLGRTLILLGVLLSLQILLGVESWLGKFTGVLPPELRKPTIGQAATRVAHVLVGSFILATTVVQAVLLHCSVSREPIYRFARNDKSVARNSVPQLEGTA